MLFVLLFDARDNSKLYVQPYAIVGISYKADAKEYMVSLSLPGRGMEVYPCTRIEFDQDVTKMDVSGS